MKPTNNKPKNNRPNYFKQNIQKFGENFLARKNVNELQMDAIRIFRDIARGNIDIQNEGKYFLDPQFMESCIWSASMKLNLFTTNYRGVLMLYNSGVNDDNTMAVLDYNKKCMEAYTIIITHLNNIKITADVNYLSAMINNLRNYRNNI